MWGNGRPQPAWVWRLCFGLLAVAGLAVIITALAASGGDLTADITVRAGTVPAALVITFGVAVAAGGVVGALWRRD